MKAFVTWTLAEGFEALRLQGALAIDGEGQIFWNGEAIHRDALDKHFAAASARQPELHLRADRKVAYEKVADVMAAAQRASIVKIAFLTQPTP